MFSRLSKRGLVHRSCRCLVCMHRSCSEHVAAVAGRDPPRYSAGKYLVLKNLCPLNGDL